MKAGWMGRRDWMLYAAILFLYKSPKAFRLPTNLLCYYHFNNCLLASNWKQKHFAYFSCITFNFRHKHSAAAKKKREPAKIGCYFCSAALLEGNETLILFSSIRFVHRFLVSLLELFYFNSFLAAGFHLDDEFLRLLIASSHGELSSLLFATAKPREWKWEKIHHPVPRMLQLPLNGTGSEAIQWNLIKQWWIFCSLLGSNWMSSLVFRFLLFRFFLSRRRRRI